MACIINSIAERLGDLAEGLQVTTASGATYTAVGPRRAIGGTIPESPFVEVGNEAVTFDRSGASCTVNVTVDVVFYMRFSNPNEEAEVLRRFLCAYHAALKADPTLGGLVESAAVESSRVDLIQTEGSEFWARVIVVGVRYVEC